MPRESLARILRMRLRFPVPITIIELACRIGIDSRTLQRILDERGQPNCRTLEKIALYLGTSVGELKRRPGRRTRAQRLTKSSERAKLLTTTPAEVRELQRLAAEGRAYAITDVLLPVESLVRGIDRKLKIIYDGRHDIRAVITGPESVEPKLEALIRNFQVSPLLIYFPMPVHFPRFGRRGQEAMKAIALSIIGSGRSFIALAGFTTMTSEVFACWPDRENLPLPDQCRIYHNAMDYVTDRFAFVSVEGQDNEPFDDNALRQCMDSAKILLRECHERESDEYSLKRSKNIYNASAIAAAIRRIIPEFIGTKVQSGYKDIISLHFHDERLSAADMDSLMFFGKFDFHRGYCSLFSGATLSAGDMRLDMSTSNLRNLAADAFTAGIARLMIQVLDELEHSRNNSGKNRRQ